MPDNKSSYAYGFNIVSDPAAIDFTNEQANFWHKANLNDSVASFFPYGECQFLDSTGIISEGVLYNDALKLNISLFQNQSIEDLKPGEKKNELTGDFVWSKYAIPDVRFNGGKITGTSVFPYVSNYRFKDIIGSSSYNLTIGTIAKNIALSTYGITPLNQKISTSAGITPDRWYRVNELYSTFLRENLAIYAFNASAKNHNTPFLTFINLKGEFYFMSLSEIFDQPVSANLTLFQSAEQGLDKETIAYIHPIFTGYDANANKYSLRQYRFTSSYTNQDYQLQDALVRPTLRGKYLMDSFSLSLDPYNTMYYGLKAENDDESYKGQANSFFTDASLSYRLDVTLAQFNSNVVAGHIVNVDVNSVISSGLSPEYSGKYMVLDSHHAMGKNGQAITNAKLAKPVMDVRSNHPFRARYI